MEACMRRRTLLAITNLMTTTRLIRLLLIAAVAGACSGAPKTSSLGATVLGPSPVPVPSGATRIYGYVFDTALHPLHGATVTVLDGPSAGMSITPDGLFYLEGVFDPDTRFRGEAEGHVAAVRTWECGRPPCGNVIGGVPPSVVFYLTPFEAPVDMAGEYTLTFDADSACTDLPEAVRTRSYPATIAASPEYGAPYRAMLGGAAFFRYLKSFYIGVAGHDVTFALGYADNAPVVEQLDATTYLAFSGAAATNVDTTRTISTPFDGWIEYCVTMAPINDQYYYCGYPDQPLPGFVSKRVTCASRNHQLTLRRRD
jgi:hypothetical protein